MKKQANGVLTGRAVSKIPTRLCTALALAAASAFACGAASAGGAGGQTEISCVNPFSGASWRIKIDYDHATVDANPARISEGEIAWRDASDGWNYRLNRKTGDLTVTLASATGGNFLYDRCQLDP
jgi:hypothetical protein